MRPASVHGDALHAFELLVCLVAVTLNIPSVSAKDFPGHMMPTAAPVIVEHDITRDTVTHAPLIAPAGLMLLIVYNRDDALVYLDVFT